MAALLENLLLFGRVLRRAGLDVHPGRMRDVVAALSDVDLAVRDEVYHTCRTLVVHSRDEIPIFDRAFDAFWRDHRERTLNRTTGEQSSVSVTEIVDVLAPEALESVSAATETEPADEPQRGVKTWSDRGGFADKDFAAFTAVELAEARKALARLSWTPGERRTRRWVAGRGPRIDLRRAMADSLHTGGDVVKLARRKRRLRPRRLVLLCDVSGSMERYSRMLLHFAHAATTKHQRVETFLFSTRLTRITKQLRTRRPDQALSAASRLVRDWSGGTRIGGALKELHQRWGRRALYGAPVVLLVSDGWDRGDPDELRDQIARLQRSCHRLVWLNPLIGTRDYAPLTRGLRAALPYVDDFLPARTFNNLVDLAIHLNALT